MAGEKDRDDLNRLRLVEASGITALPEWAACSAAAAAMLGETDTSVMRGLAVRFAVALANLAAVVAAKGAASERAAILTWMRKHGEGYLLTTSGLALAIEHGEHDV